jgi:hypothetical protein
MVPRGGTRKFNQINNLTESERVKPSHMIIMLSAANVPQPSDLVLGVDRRSVVRATAEVLMTNFDVVGKNRSRGDLEGTPHVTT